MIEDVDPRVRRRCDHQANLAVKRPKGRFRTELLGVPVQQKSSGGDFALRDARPLAGVNEPRESFEHGLDELRELTSKPLASGRSEIAAVERALTEPQQGAPGKHSLAWKRQAPGEIQGMRSKALDTARKIPHAPGLKGVRLLRIAQDGGALRPGGEERGVPAGERRGASSREKVPERVDVDADHAPSQRQTLDD
jgi:hypothetical protein